MVDVYCDFSGDDAQKWGSADIAAILSCIRSQLRKNTTNQECFHDGRVWTVNTPEAWSRIFPWLSPSQIERLFGKMEKDGLLIRDRRNRYTLNEDEFKR